MPDGLHGPELNQEGRKVVLSTLLPKKASRSFLVQRYPPWSQDNGENDGQGDMWVSNPTFYTNLAHGLESRLYPSTASAATPWPQKGGTWANQGELSQVVVTAAETRSI